MNTGQKKCIRDSKNYKCTHCDESMRLKSSESVDSLVMHGKICTGFARPRPGKCEFTCFACNYSSNKKSCMFDHVRLHLGVKPYKCPFCSYCTSNKPSLKRHSCSRHKATE